jgi:hypothetical protein
VVSSTAREGRQRFISPWPKLVAARHIRNAALVLLWGQLTAPDRRCCYPGDNVANSTPDLSDMRNDRIESDLFKTLRFAKAALATGASQVVRSLV